MKIKKLVSVILVLSLLFSALILINNQSVTAASTIPSSAITLVDFGGLPKESYWASNGTFELETGSTFGDNSEDVSFTSNNTSPVTEHQLSTNQTLFDPALLAGKGTIGVLVYIDPASDLAKFNVKLNTTSGAYQYCVTGITKGSVQLVELPLNKFKNDQGVQLTPEDYSKLSGKVTVSSGWNAQWVSDTDHPYGWNKPTGGSFIIKWSNFYVYGTPYVEPSATYRTTATGQPEPTTVKPNPSSKCVMNFKSWNSDCWTSDLKTGASQIIDTAGHPIADANGNSFPTDWGAYRVIRNDPNKTAMQFQVGWNNLPSGITSGSDGLRSFVLFESESKQNAFTIKLTVPAVDSKGNPILVNGVQRVDYYSADTNPGNGYTNELIANDDNVHYVFLPWKLFKIDDKSKTDVPAYLNDSYASKANAIIISFGYAWTSDGKGNTGPVGFISDIWTYNESDIPDRFLYSPFTAKNGYISGLDPKNNTVEQLKASFIYQFNDISVFNSRNIEIQSGSIATGYKAVFTLKSGASATFTIILYGDIDGSGTIDTMDLLLIKKKLLNLKDITNPDFKEAANCSRDAQGSIDASDLLAIKKSILNIKPINQN